MKAMAPYCPVNDVDFRNFETWYELGVREDQSGMVSFILVKKAYNVRTDQKHESGKYDMSGPNDMKDMTKV